jgi:replicative DNA helicase
MDNTEVKIQLPFSEDRQDAVLGYLLLNSQFFLQSRNRIKPNWFIKAQNARLFAIQLNLYDRYRRFPTIDEIKSSGELMAEPQATRNDYYARINLCTSRTQTHGLDIIRDELTEWMHSVIFQNGIEKSVTLFNAKKTKESYEHVTGIVKQLREISFDDSEEVKFENPVQFTQDSQLDFSKAITTGLSILDRALITDAVAGGLVPGDMTIILAATNVGKTSVMITTIVHNLKRKKKVLFMTHEGRPADIRNKIMCSYIGCTMSQLMSMYKTPEGIQMLENAASDISKWLTYIPYNKPGMSVEEVEPIIRRYQDSLKMSNPEGKGFDLLVVDYPAKLTTNRASKGLLPQRISDHIVYEYYTQLALEYNFHVLCAIQTNREGSKVNQGKEDRFLTMEDVAESWGPMQSATNVISLNRDVLSQQKNIMTFYVCKSRASRVGTAVVVRTDFAKCLTHSEEMGGLYYYANAPMSDKVDRFLADFNGKQLPDNLIEISRDI